MSWWDDLLGRFKTNTAPEESEFDKYAREQEEAEAKATAEAEARRKGKVGAVGDPRAEHLSDAELDKLIADLIKKSGGGTEPVQAPDWVPEHLREQWNLLDENDRSSMTRKYLESQSSGSQPGYVDKKGAPKLKIVQDEAFARSGLKSGDVVCIRIP